MLGRIAETIGNVRRRPDRTTLMFELKTLSTDAIPFALAKAERYRLLNEPGEAESICLDVLRIEPDNQLALVTLILALTDQFTSESSAKAAAAATEAAARLQDEYERWYYSGIIGERRGKSLYHKHQVGTGRAMQEWIRDAMGCYERAEAIRPPGHDDAILRWNACARFLMSQPRLEPDTERPDPIQLE
jgi:hypothetical protein